MAEKNCGNLNGGQECCTEIGSLDAWSKLFVSCMSCQDDGVHYGHSGRAERAAFSRMFKTLSTTQGHFLTYGIEHTSATGLTYESKKLSSSCPRFEVQQNVSQSGMDI